MSEAKYRVVANNNPFLYGSMSIEKLVIGWFGKPKWKRIKGTHYGTLIQKYIRDDIEEEADNCRRFSDVYYDENGRKI